MIRMKRGTSPRTFSLVLALAAAPFLVSASHANTLTNAEAPLQTAASMRAPTSGLNLLAAPRTGQPVVRVRSMGRGSWVCSPAGFGQRSRCHRN